MNFFDISNSVLLVDGVEISGYGTGGDVVQGDQREDGFTDSVGADGNMIVVGNTNESGMFTIRLQQGAASNVFLNGLYLRQKINFTARAILFKDLVSGEQVGGSAGYIVKPAPFVRGNAANDQTWNIVVEKYDALFASLPIVPQVPSL